MKSPHDYDIIRDYLHGLVDSKTAQEISERMATDETTRSIAVGAVLLEKEFTDNEAIDQYLDGFRQKQFEIIGQQTKPVPIAKRLWFRAAASLALLICVGMAVRLLVSLPDYQSVIDQELGQQYPVSNLSRSGGDGSATEKAFQLYTNGDYVNASIYFEQATPGEKDKASVMFYEALSYLYAGRYEKAIDLFESERMANSRYAQQAQWFQALAFLRLNNNKQAVAILKSIEADHQHFKQDVARQLLEQLD